MVNVPKYRLPDEPRPGALGNIVVEPMWPLLASMLGGAWIGWPWFVLNAHAVGSPTKWRQTALAAGGVVVTVALVAGLIAAESAALLQGSLQVRLALLVILALKLTLSYALFVQQSRSVQLFEYYRGVVRNGFIVVIGVAILGDRLLAGLPPLLRVALR